MNSFDSTDSFSRRRAPRFDKPLDFSVLHNSSSSTLSPSYHQNNFQGPKSAFVLPSHDWPWQDQLSAPAYSVNHGQHSSTPRMSSQWSTVAPNPWPVWNSAQNYTTSGQRQLSYRNSNDGFNATNVFSPRGTGFWDKEMNVFNFDTHAVKSDGNLGGSPVDSGSSYRPPRTRRRLPSCVECVFCKNNKEKEEVYKTHILKDPEGNVMCPKLRAYNCPVCNNGGGPHAHTIRYCPRNRPNGWRGNNHV